MSDTTTREVQQVILEIYKEFRRVCDQHNLRYFAIGGTCIGAVRHRGFIPWDDDIDVAMPYDDYQKLRSMKSAFRPPFELYDYKNHLYYDHFFLKLHNVDTAFIEQPIVSYPGRYTGCYIDIMPLYGISDNKMVQDIRIMKCLCFFKLNHTQRFPIRAKKSFMGKVLWILNLPIRAGKPFNYYSDKVEAFLSKYEFGSTPKIIFGWRGERHRLLFDYADFSDHIEMPFEDTTMRVPVGYDNYLKKDFGDYMTLPPETERISVHPAAVIDLHKSYREYIKEGIK